VRTGEVSALVLLSVAAAVVAQSSSARAVCGGGSPTWTAASASQADVLDCIAVAQPGDTVQVPGNTNDTWTARPQGCSTDTMLCLKQGLKLRGGRCGTTTITLSGAAPGGAICYEPDAASVVEDTPFEVAGFTFDGTGLPYPEGMIDVRNEGATPLTRVRIHHNVFRNNDTRVISINGPVYGVADSNRFEECQTVIRAEGHDADSWELGHREYGTARNFFFEDNTIVAVTMPSAGAFTAGQGGGLVVRYNSYDLGGILLEGNQWQDLHGLQSMTDTAGGTQCGYAPFDVPGACLPDVRSCEQWSQIKTEWYGNVHRNLVNPYSTPQEWMRHRGSWLLMFNNLVLGTGHMPVPVIWQYSCDTCQSDGGAGNRHSHHVQNTYVWNNVGEGEGNRPIAVAADFCGSYAVGTPYTITENVDFWNYDPSCSGTAGCAAGIGVGPSPPTGSCAPGVAFWVGSAGSELPTTSAELVAETQAGRLYRCRDDGTWEPYYQPFTYPHPLRTAEPPPADDCTSPPSDAGCGCAAAGGSPRGLLPALALLVPLFRRRRATRRRVVAAGRSGP
jgi:MYXO-CTERM domain-containing protein